MRGCILTYSGFKGRTFKLCVLTRWDFNFCVRSSPLRGYERKKGRKRKKDRKVEKGDSERRKRRRRRQRRKNEEKKKRNIKPRASNKFRQGIGNDRVPGTETYFC